MQLLETLYLNDISRIATDRQHGILANTWLRPVEHSEMLETAERISQLLQESNIDKLLLNAMAIGKLLPYTKEWLSTTYYKSLSDLGLKKLARVLPENVFNRLSFEAVVTRAEALGCVNFEVKNFTSDEAALRWLRD
ncbi:hypothetical protein I0P70_08825 [Pontibacter sp. FD36]|uniref:SpoIIAA-like n=1 Tax=Pontibacter lucknowensis TaxID=1077936 RepID=A0A1N6UVH8_9BACT|nr:MULTISPECIES: hypothetical protein [Pontibacter]EJF10474.1 hypothetical protein O71_08947 [Pontibacter sp. BAB1700]MBF8963347.1 hypothetical protein [Pontibacter sp. FD36]SIQ69650.1 hypothetical protein SAMN05421545_1102 [Pontibacter lucknowensis]